MADGEAPNPLDANQPAALGLGEGSGRGADEDQDEWEYEYSTTETETYYLTIELSYPEFKGVPTGPNPNYSRGGHYKQWLGFATDRGEPLKPSAHANTEVDNHIGQTNDDDDNDDEEEPIPAVEAEDENLDIDPTLMNETYEMDAARRREQEKQQAQATERGKEQRVGKNEGDMETDIEPLEDIQILDLHSPRPLISYRGRVFEGQWAEVIGTEVILANHEHGRPLPALRNLPGDVDLLAASCSRILTTEKVLKPKQPEEDPLAPIREEYNIRIPYGKDKHGEKAQQANFLERLIALKLKKGEKDQVTVYAKAGAGKNFRDNRDPNLRPRRRKTRQGDEELDDDGYPIQRTKRKATRSIGRPRTRRRWNDRGALQSEGKVGGLSVPTPQRWEDLGDDDDDDDEGEAEDDESDELEEDEDDDGTDVDDTDDSQASDDQSDDDNGPEDHSVPR